MESISRERAEREGGQGEGEREARADIQQSQGRETSREK